MTIADDDVTLDREVVADRRFGNQSLAFASGVASDVGAREENQDAYLLADQLVAVADGMGGLRDGRAVAHLIVEGARRTGESEAPLDVVRSINDKVVERWGSGTAGSTLAAIWLRNGLAHVVSIGDSRVWIDIEGSGLVQLGHDHTVEATLQRLGRPADGVDEQQLPALISYVGMGSRLSEINYEVMPVAAGDRFLVSSDGVHRLLSPSEMASSLRRHAPEGAAQALVRAALAAGGRDNATALVAEVCSG